MGEPLISTAFDGELVRQPRKRNYAPRKTFNGKARGAPKNLATFPGLPPSAFAESATDVIYGVGPGRPYNHDITHLQEHVATIRESLGLALERWQRILQAAKEEENHHICARATNEIEAIYTVLQRLERL